MGEVTSIQTVQRQAANGQAETRMEKLLGEAQLKLIETGSRNRLIHTPRGAKRPRALSITGNVSDQVFANLVRENKPLQFLATKEIVGIQREAATLETPRLVPPKASHRNGLQTSLLPELLRKRLHAMYGDAKTAEEERGVNILFLVLGFLRWYEDEKSDVPRDAPLILLPVSLVRDAKRSTFDLKLREDDIVANQALQKRLCGDFGIALPDVPETEDWQPSSYFDTIANAVAAKRRWSIEANAIELGFYSCSKLLMMRDLEPGNWPDNALVSHPLLRRLLIEGFAAEPPVLPGDARLDEILSPIDLIHVADADSSQTRIIETVRAGRNLVVQGPPGTGKSQMIMNIIAAAVHDGQSVLFVAEKMAALNVVHARLRARGLDDICLELHSQAASKRKVAERLDRTLQAATGLFAMDETARQLAAVRDRLNHVAKRLHAQVGDTGMTPYRALSIQIAAAGRGFTPDARLVEEAALWTGSEFAENARLIEWLARLTESVGPLNSHVYFGVRRRSALQPADFQRQIPKLQALAGKAAALAAYATMVTHYFGLPPDPTLAGVRTLIAIFRAISNLPRGAENIAAKIAIAPSPRRIADAAALGEKWLEQQAPYLHTFHQAAWTGLVAELRAPLAQGAVSWLARASKAYREAARSLANLLSVPLPKRPADRLALLDALLASQALRSKFAAEAGVLASLLGDVWQEKKTVFRLIHEVARTVGELADFDPHLNAERVIGIARDVTAEAHGDHLETGLDEVVNAFADTIKFLDLDIAAIFQTDSVATIDLNRLSERAAGWAANPVRFEEWARLAKADREVRAAGPAWIADALAAGQLDPRNAQMELETAYAEACWKKAIAANSELATFDGDRHDELVAQFIELEERSREAAVRSVRARHQAAIPRGAQNGMAVIRGEIGRKRAHMPLRKLMKAAGRTIQKIKPIFLMSPVSVAQFLPPGSVDFDILVIDEASQVRPEDALGLIARCRRMVVVGDMKQLPPTSFFDRMIADETEHGDGEEAPVRETENAAPITDLESILSLCEARGLESQMLRWHYRSRHPSLIAVSNAVFYRRLVMPPAPETERTAKGLILRRVPGAYDRGGKRTNPIEAEAIVSAVASHARSSANLSLGIVTFSTAQRDLIGDILETRRRADPVLDACLADGGHEDVFVKNLENVQGDERDVILISIGYGPRKANQPLDSMAFGPVSAEGGERRLNVLFTRARVRCEVFASFAPGDINLERATGEGPCVLKRFLQFAETGILQESCQTGADFDSPFEAAVAKAIERFGYKVEPQVGSPGFKIDLAVRDPARPGRYMLAIECDGATYHSALWARERDRLRQQVLEDLGWRFYRVWSTDWFYRRAGELEKLKQALDAARAAGQHDLPPPLPSQLIGPACEPRPEGAADSRHIAYALATCEIPPGLEAHEIGAERLAAIVRSVIEQEGPIHRDEIARRVAFLFGKQRCGSRIAEAVQRGEHFLQINAPDLSQEAEFWFTPEQKNASIVRDRSAAPLSLRKLDIIASSEIRAAIAIARQRNSGLSESELPDAVARLFGFQKTTAELRNLVLSLAG
ncbi:MAG: DUF3320 domain-containing protein [Pseudomonadota bacterium]|nr:DUF3320 domain-containing protein [Pseudomonadota bacterium]